MNNVIVTGANGFTGSHVLNNLKEELTSKYKVTPACRTVTKLPEEWQKSTLVGDLMDDDYISELTKKADVICHTAAWAEMNGSDRDSKKYFFNPTINLINGAIKNGVKDLFSYQPLLPIL